MRVKKTLIATIIAALAVLAFAGSAQAKLVGEFTKFENCDWKNPEVFKCIYAVTTGGTVVMGSKKVPIVNPVTLQGGYSGPNASNISKFYGATKGDTLEKAGQPLPGGLAGLVNCPEISNFILRALCKATFENGFTGVNTVLELAKPPSAIEISEFNLAHREGVALKLPIKVHLENPLLGSNCYVGSEGSPIIWNLTTGKTAPPPPNTSIEGKVGEASFREEGLIYHLEKSELVDNAWAAPSTTGCGGIFSFILDPIVSLASGLPAAAGKNSAVLVNTVDLVSTPALQYIDEENP